MGLFDTVLHDVLNSASSSGSQPAGGGGGEALLQEAIGLLNSPQVGGVPGLVKSFQQAGLGHLIGSWIGPGANLAVDATQLQQVLSPELINSIAQRIGIPPELVTQGLTQILPHLIDHATPDGTPQSNALVDEGLSLLKSKLFG